jgi:hypothetical protein
MLMNIGLEETEAVNAIHHIPRFPTANCSTASLPLPLGRYTRRTTIDNSSILVSETESFQEREVELSMVKKRFATTEAYRSPNTPRSSKFREEFDFQSSALEADTPTKPSALVRLARLASRSYDGTTGMEEMLGVPLLDVTPGALRHADTGLSPLGDDSVSNIWGKAVKRAADNRSKGAAGNLYTPDKKLRQDDSSRKKSQISQDSRAKGAFQFPRTLSWGKRGKQKSAGVDEMDAHEKAAAEYQQRFQERMAAKEMVMDSWEAELAATAKRAQAKSRNIIHKIKPTGPDRRYPASWSRFPCHSRSDRSFTASTSEGVEQRDFAIKEILDNGEPVWFHNEHKYHLYHHDDDEHPSHEEAGPTILGKLQAKLGEKLQELELFEDQAFSDRTGGRRSSMNLAGTLEYPELEILAVTEGTITQKQLENQVDREIRGDVGGQRMKMTKKAALEGSVDLDSEDEEEKLQELEMSIADPRFYDDCIANPALEGNNVDGADSDGDGVEEMQPKSSKKEKFRTWSSRDWDGYKYGSNGGGRNVSLGIVALRHSTDEFRCEIERMEKVEREKVLRAAEDAWGVRCG